MTSRYIYIKSKNLSWLGNLCANSSLLLSSPRFSSLPPFSFCSVYLQTFQVCKLYFTTIQSLQREGKTETPFQKILPNLILNSALINEYSILYNGVEIYIKLLTKLCYLINTAKSLLKLRNERNTHWHDGLGILMKKLVTCRQINNCPPLIFLYFFRRRNERHPLTAFYPVQ